MRGGSEFPRPKARELPLLMVADHSIQFPEYSETTLLAIDTLTTNRARRALSHGGGIDGVLFLLLAAAGIGMVVVLIVAGLQSAEASATRDAGAVHPAMNSKSAEIGDL